MDPEKKPEEAPEGDKVELEVNLSEIIDAIIALDKDDQEKIYEALSESLGKPLSGEPKKESNPEAKSEESGMKAEDLAKSFM